MNKYGARKITIDNIRFDSLLEGERYRQLKLLEKSGVIQHLEVHPVFKLTAGIKYIADFSYLEKEACIVEDVKGVQTAVFRLKARLFKHCYPTLDLKILTAKEIR